MNIIDLPDDILIYLFDKYLNLNDLLAVYQTCNRFKNIIDYYNVSAKYSRSLPLLDFTYPNGKAYVSLCFVVVVSINQCLI